MSFDFQSIFDTEDPIYVHSNNSNFQNAFSGISFEEILDTIAANLTTVLDSNIRMLESMEEQMVQNQLKKYKNAGVKPPFQNREEFLDYFRKFKNRMDRNKNLQTYTFVNFKKAQNYTRDIVKAGENLKANTIDEILEKEKKLDFVTKQAKKRSEKTHIMNYKKTAKALQRLLRSMQESLPELISFLATQLITVYDPTWEKDEKDVKGDEKSSKRVQEHIDAVVKLTKEVAGPDGVKNIKIKTAKEIEEDLRTFMKEQGPLTFFAQFLDSSNATEYYGNLLEKQINTPLGELYEPAIVESMKELVKQDLQANLIPLFDEKKIKTTGRISRIKNVSTADFVFDDMESGGFKTFFSASVKLVAPDSKIKSETQSKDLWDSLIRFIGKEKANQISYIRQNVLSIPSYAADEKEEKFLSLDLQKLKDFDQKIFTLLGAAKLFIGFFEVIDNQIRSFGFEDNSFYFVVYLYETKNIYRSTDILKAIVEELKTNFKSNFLNVTIAGAEMMNKAEYPEPSRDSLKNLYEAKLKSMRNARRKSQQSTYKTLLNDNDVIQELKTINQIIGKHPFEKGFKMIPTITLKKVSDKFK